jgi:3',5'-cyclic AMP phosphodiesterase CpdA
MFRIAHISDLHIPPLPPMSPKQLAGKRLLGLVAWHKKWKSEHQQTILDALQTHLQELEPDHICITGDITFTTLPAEVDTAADWISRLGDPQQISLIPGNHDAYVSGALEYALEKWSHWMLDDDGQLGFPYLHRRGPVDIIGLSSAVATPPAISLGRIGPTQLNRTEALLGRIKAVQRPSLLMVHHPPQDGAASRKRALSDRKALQEILCRSPVDLILHGHLHYPTRAVIDCPSGSIPVLGAASASTIGIRKSVAHYHMIEIETGSERPQMTVHHYQYNTASGVFSLDGTQSL